MYLCISLYCDACLKSSALRVGVKTLQNTTSKIFWRHPNLTHYKIDFDPLYMVKIGVDAFATKSKERLLQHSIFLLILLSRHGRKLVTRNAMTWRPAITSRQHRTTTTLPKLLTRKPVVCFLEVDKTRLWCPPKNSQKFAGEWKFGL